MAVEQPAEREIRDALDRVLSSTDFDASGRNRRFLGFVVDESLAGRGPWLKAYTIATAVFGRSETFDPQTDAIVRIEARRLRDSLERYYLKAGKNDAIRITIPKGGYLPAFAAPARAGDGFAPGEQPVPDSGREPAVPAILVTPFEEEGDQTAFRNVTRGIRRQLAAGLTRFTSIRVFSADDDPPTGRAPIDESEIDFVVSGGTTLTANRLAVEVLLTEAATGQCLWGDTYEQSFEAGAVQAARDEIIGKIVRAVAEPYGIIFSRMIRGIGDKPTQTLDPRSCVVRFHQYWRTYDPAKGAAVRLGLERAVEIAPNDAEALACLSMLYSDEHRFERTPAGSGVDMPARAEALALRAVELSPYSSTAYRALSLARWSAGDLSASIGALETGRRLNPNDTTVMAELGFRYALLANWRRAVPLLDAAFARNPALPSTYRVALALFHYVHLNYEEALAEARRVEAPSAVYGFVLRAIAAAKLGRLDEAEQAVARISELAPSYGEIVEADLGRRNVHPDIIHAVVEGLRSAGIAGGRPPFGQVRLAASPSQLRVVPPPSAG